MFAVTSPSDRAPPPAPVAGMHGKAAVCLIQRDNQTRLADLHQASPQRVLFPVAADGDPLTAALVTTSGGLVGGDSLDIALTVGPQAAGLFVAQAAEKIYRSSGADCRVELDLTVGEGGWLEYLPQETILFDGARLRRQTQVAVAPGARLLAGEILVFGRIARGERMARGLVRDEWRVHRGGRLAWTDALHLDGDIAARLDDPAGFGGCHALATVVLVVDDPAPFLPVVRSCPVGPGLYFGATIVNGILVARWLASDGLALRRSFAAAWGELRTRAGGFPPSLPRLWHV